MQRLTDLLGWSTSFTLTPAPSATKESNTEEFDRVKQEHAANEDEQSNHGANIPTLQADYPLSHKAATAHLLKCGVFWDLKGSATARSGMASTRIK